MTKLSGVNVGSSDQNIEIGVKRLERDYEHWKMFYGWFEVRNPFNMEDGNLHSLLSGVVFVHGKDTVNCDEAESIGDRIHKSLNDVNFTEVKP